MPWSKKNEFHVVRTPLIISWNSNVVLSFSVTKIASSPIPCNPLLYLPKPKPCSDVADEVTGFLVVNSKCLQAVAKSPQIFSHLLL